LFENLFLRLAPLRRALLDKGAYITAPNARPDEQGKTAHIGFVTSSYHSPTLGRSFAMALVANGLNRMDEEVAVPVGGKMLQANICDAVFIDKENSRRD
jgi:sarcosine oxidase subunit alpha